MQAKAVETSGVEAKLSRLKNLMQEQGFFDHPDQRLLLFTEFKDTLDYLVAKLVEWGFRVGCIHGSMRIGSRDEPGSRLHTEQQFREGAIQILVATRKEKPCLIASRSTHEFSEGVPVFAACASLSR